ncbi:heparin lyase I family protein [Rhizobium herbae]|uniref:Polysaccharide lyase n=1 Tax=Rhizobium herbae TaxID=508661 RepID=A0ABS4ES82_9HYPH|nr:heparin lyase I family protein [Rhizobium herbae]MBP1860676.1 hypothetical protein [Rhizobium herbae]
MKRILTSRSRYISCATILAVSTVIFTLPVTYANEQRLLNANQATLSSSVMPLSEKFSYNDGEYENQSAQKTYSVGVRRSAEDDLVLRFEVRANDRASFDSNDIDRAEATSGIRFPKGEVIWNAYRVKIADGFSVPSGDRSWFIIGQWHGSRDDSRSPYIVAELQGTDLVFLSRYLSNGQTASREMYRMNDVPRGEWMNIVMEHKVSSTAGLLNIWVNGRQVVNFDGPIGYWDHEQAGYWKFGIYRSRHSADAIVEYRDVVTTTHDLSSRATMTN